MGRLTAIVIRVNKHSNTCAQWGTVLSALGTMAALAVAYSAFTVQNTQLKEQIKTQAQASAEERERFLNQLNVQRKQFEQFVNSFHNQQTAAFYTQAHTITRFLQDHPSLYDYFERRPNLKQSARDHSDVVKARFQKATSEEQALVLIGVESLADFMDTAFAQRDTLRPETGERNTLWNYFVDFYDENPILRELLGENVDEYSVAEMLKPQHRFQQYIGTAHRRRP